MYILSTTDEDIPSGAATTSLVQANFHGRLLIAKQSHLPSLPVIYCCAVTFFVDHMVTMYQQEYCKPIPWPAVSYTDR